MPVASLWVEGDLDGEVLLPLLQGAPVVHPASCGKRQLTPRVRVERQRTGNDIRYIRDRDFDFEPPVDRNSPTPDQYDGAIVIGWRWCRHEIENYLIDPDIVSAAIGLNVNTFKAELVRAGKQIRHYETARWVVGRARTQLPPHYDLNTRPQTLTSKYELPEDLAEPPSFDWARHEVGAFLEHTDAALSAAAITASIADYKVKITEAGFNSSEEVLVWCSGKDMLAAIAPWLQAQGFENPGMFLMRLRDWVRQHSGDAIAILPEWNALVQLLRA